MSISALLGELLERHTQLKMSCHYKHFVWFYSPDDVLLTPDLINVFTWYASTYFQTFGKQKYKYKLLENFLEIRALILLSKSLEPPWQLSFVEKACTSIVFWTMAMERQYFAPHRFIRCLSSLYNKPMIWRSRRSASWKYKLQCCERVSYAFRPAGFLFSYSFKSLKCLLNPK